MGNFQKGVCWCTAFQSACTRAAWLCGRAHSYSLWALRNGAGPNETSDWGREFDIVVQDQIKKGQLDQLPKFQLLGAVAQQALPSHEHYLPLLVAAGALLPDEMPRL